ncbi:MAG: methyltransferase domain-containing protein [Candidatus Eremiobacteraeota bacterium]|nr:methyltransferase domain-containing protein [Candidatus Eremiobacteraeota bacterium]
MNERRLRKPWYGIIGELFWGCSLTLFEVVNLGGFPWWWKLHWLMYRHYRGFDPDGRVRQLRGNNPGSLAYGETPVSATRRMLALAQVPVGSTLVDLGCGRGLVAMAAACSGYRAVGVEVMPEYLEAAPAITEALGIEVEWIIGDFLELELPSGDCYFVASTAFPQSVRDQLGQRLAQGQARLIITLDWIIEHPDYEAVSSLRLPTTWGTSLFTVHRLRGTEP